MVPLSYPVPRGVGFLRSQIQFSATILFPAGVRHASLSAIHRGLRRSEKIQYGEARTRAAPSQSRRSSKSIYNDLTERALEGTGSKRQRLKLLQKLRKKQQEEDGTGPQSRRKRFVDPDSSFGKSSLVYQLKHGSLKNLAADLKIEEPVKPRSFRERKIEERSSRPATQNRDQRANDADNFTSRHRGRDGWDSRRSTEGRRREAATQAARRKSGDDLGLRQSDQSEPRRVQRRTNLDGIDGERLAPRERRGNMMPMAIKYTTAASQFLYGKSVVRAALEQGRRQLYRLYIYGGENRQDSRDNALITMLANERNVPITIVPNEDQRLMDKMSMGRPHNGFILETSPLPQKPVTKLGELVESPLKLGFHVELDHQTKEDELVNGTDTFVKRERNVKAKPLVLLLNEILDPGNLGALLRTASYLGVDAVGITSRGSANLTPVVLKSAAGAVEELSIFTVASPVSFIEESRKAGWKAYAAVAPPGTKLARMHSAKFVSTDAIEEQDPLRNDPCILILGNEGHGLSKPLKMAADYELSVPRFVANSSVDSLNVSVAAGLLCHSFMKTSPSQPRGRGSRDENGNKDANPSSEAHSRNELF
jgi:21S rRNA (GM2251-2'-O)-methyltransferase